MEKFSGEMKRAELQKQALFKTYEQVQSQASSVLLFTLQWKDLEERFDGIRSSLERRAEELREGERSLAEREEGLRSARRRVEEREEEVRRKEVELRSVETRLEECEDEERKEESGLVLKREVLSECDSLIRDKEKELRSLMQATEECRRDYESTEEEVEKLRHELDSKEKKVRVVQSLLEENARELDVKVEELGSVKRSLDECSRAVQMKREELSVVHRRLDHSLEAHEENEKRLRVLERTIKERDEEVAMKAGELQSLKDKIKDCHVELKLKEEEFRGICKSIEKRSKDLESKECQLHSLDILIEEHKEEVKSKRKEFEEINRLINERFTALALKDRELESIETSIGKRSREMELREKTSGHPGVMPQNWKCPYGPALASCLNSQSTIAHDGKQMQMFIYRHFWELNRVCHKLLEIIQTSANAATLVLDAMEGFYPQDSGNRDGFLDIGMIRRSCIFLLENLIRSSAEIKPQQKEAAMKLAVEWKGKLKFSPSLEHPLEFQIAQELQVLSSSAVLPGSFGSIQHWQKKTEEPENFAVHNADDSSVVNPPLPTVSVRKDLQHFQTELLSEITMICEQISHKLQNSSDPAKLVLDVFAGSYTQYSDSKDMNLETDVLRSQIVLLEQLVRIPPLITDEVQEGAMKLAREWKVKLSDKPKSGLEVLAFQHFLAAYNLVSLLNESEILKLAEIVSPNNDAPLLDQSLGLVNEITAHQLAYLLLSPESISNRPD
ncbi:uncharacterized protein LOC115681018 [Syzygium oleosum]|uniref:uncharacterized protein LOC115681018 n=1 Tax=Syzygium oleosum TaxID=219896 RepID=UPI0024BBB9B9|nr:uncharacterized protein LOC115681018 [Syzygium oleosum]